MDRVEVVCVTMGQKDLTIADKMHITGDAVFGNQADGYRKETQLNAGRACDPPGQKPRWSSAFSSRSAVWDVRLLYPP